MADEIPAAVVPESASYVDSGGALRQIPAEQAGDAEALGWSPASAEQVHAHDLQQRFGDASGQFQAGSLAALRAATLGLSDVALTKGLGVDPEAIKGLEEANPVASGVGTAAGIAVPLALSGGLSAPAEGAAQTVARATGPALVARAGQAVTRAVEGALPAGEGLVGRLVAKAAAAGAGSAIEGAAYGAGQVVSEAALGDPNLTAQSALATVGISALVGGALGGTGGILGAAAKEVMPSTGGAGERLAEWLGEVEGNRNIKAAGAIQSDINRALKTKSRDAINKIGQEFGKYDLVGPFSTPAETLERAKALADVGASEAKQITAAADASATAHSWQAEELTDAIAPKVIAKLKEKASTLHVVPQFEEALGRIAEVYGGRPLGVSDLHAMRTDLDALIYKHGRALDPFAKDVAKPLKKVRDFVAGQIEAGIEQAGGDVGAWKEAMRKQEVGLTAVGFANKGLSRAHGNNIVSPTEFLGALSGGLGAGLPGAMATGAATAAVRRHGAGVLGWAAGGLRELLEGGAAGRLTPEMDAAIDSTATRVLGEERGAATSRETRIVTQQRPRGEPAHYEVVEAGSLVPSHDPEGFRPRPDYPTGVQEREYHLQPEEQMKVVQGGRNLDHALLLSDERTAVGGPPIVAAGDKRLVLGGNGRTMMIQRAFADDASREAYRAALLDKAPAFGIARGEVEGLRAPVLVRVADEVPGAAPRDALSGAVRRYNEGMTQELSPRARAVAEARSLSPEAVESFGAMLGDDEKSLRDVMRERPGEFVDTLQRSGLITPQNRAKWVAGGNLTDEGKDRIEGMFLGRVVGTGDRLAAASPAALQKVERATPALLRVSAVNPAMDEIGTVRAALDLMREADRHGITLDQLAAQGGLFGGGDVPPEAVAMAKVLDRMKPREVAQRFREWADLAAQDPRQASLFGAPPTPDEARRVLFNHIVPPEANIGTWGRGEVPPPPTPTPATRVAVLATLERKTQTVARAIDSGASTLLRGGPRGETIGRAEVVAGVAREFSASNEDAARRHNRRVAEVQRLSEDPEAMHGAIMAQNAGLDEHAPQTSQALAVASARAVSFLASKLPAHPQQGPLAPKWEPSPSEVAKFGRYYEAVQNPLVILKQATAGTLTPEALEAVAAVYPDLLARMRQGIIEKMSAHASVPYRSRIALSALLGQDVDGSLGMLARTQASYRAPSRKQDAAPPAIKPTQGGLKSISLSGRSLTPMQAAGNRRG